MASLLANKAVIVLGADDIGAGIAEAARRDGARVELLDTPPAPDAAARAVNEAALRLGAVYGLVVNVLPAPVLGTLELQKAASFAAAFVRVQSAAAAMQAALPYMQQGGEGRIVIIGHRYGESVNEGLAAYNSAALGLIGLTRSAALDWGRYQIASNMLLPLANTAEFQRCRSERPGVVDLLTAQLPLQRIGDCADDIGGSALFLLSDAVRFVNGQVLHADGGQHVAGPVINPIKFA